MEIYRDKDTHLKKENKGKELKKDRRKGKNGMEGKGVKGCRMYIANEGE